MAKAPIVFYHRHGVPDSVVGPAISSHRHNTTMSANTASDTVTDSDRVSRLEDLDMPRAAIKRFLKSRELRVPKEDDNFVKKVVAQISVDTYDGLVSQYLFAGRQTINYFVVVGISDLETDEISSRVKSHLPNRSEVENVTKEPFLGTTHKTDSRLYLSIGYNEVAGGVDPATGAKSNTLITKRIIVIVSENSDLVEIRGSDTTQVERTLDQICRSIGKYNDSVKRRPNLGTEFQERFNKMVESYFNLRVKVDDMDDETLDTIAFTSTEDEDGNRHDARKSKRVKQELSEGSEITTGYVELRGFRFRINRDQAKISFMKYEREENLNQVTKFIDDVLRETEEYSQGQLSGIENVPE
jgi:hypothetical protein